MSEEEWLDSGPYALGLLLDWQSERDKLKKLCAGNIVAAILNVAAGSFKFNAATSFPELIPALTKEELKAERKEQAAALKQRILNGKRKRHLEGAGTKGTGHPSQRSSQKTPS
jgi:hypothetical protein